MNVDNEIISKLNKLKLESERLTIRKFSIEEIEFNVEDEMNPSLMKYIKDIQSLKETRLKNEEIAALWGGNQGEWFIGAIRKKKDNSYVGIVCLRYESVVDHIVEIGWRLREAYHGKGYATEAARELLKYISENLKANKIMAYCDYENKASINIMAKLNMKKEAILIKHFRINNVWKDEGIFSLIVENDVN